MEDKKVPQRLQSLDALRGFDMFFIMGGASVFVALATLYPCPFLQAIADQMNHVEWNGLKHHDTIFPLFLFIAGISFPFSLAKQREHGKTNFTIYMKIIRRGFTLVLLGFIYNGLLNFDFEHQRYASVLARIGLGWMFAALLFVNAKAVTRAWITALILISYWLIMAYIPAPDANGADIFTAQGSIAGYFDRNFLPGTFAGKDMDPEGILSTFPAICTALLGMFTGELVKSNKEGLTGNKKVLIMVIAGIVLLAVGLLWNQVFPINKKMWTSSFVCVVGSYSLLMFALFFYLIDVRNWRKWILFFTVIGMNSITIYLGQKFIDFSFTKWKIFAGFISVFPGIAQPFVDSICYVTVCWLFLYFLYRQRIFLKI
ncbi:MAG: DUF5009 domain-containing protein [Parabacteroides sp.]